MFAIIGAAGKVGYSTSLKLREAGVPVRAILRDATKAGPLRSIGCEVVLADLQDPASLGRAIANAHAVQVICPPAPQAEDAVGDMRLSIDSLATALEQARPKLVLAISDYGAHLGEGVGMPSMFHLFEQRLRQLDMPKVFLRSAEHMEGWGLLIPAVIATGVLPSLHHPVDRAFPTIAARDVGQIAADLLLRANVNVREHIVHAEGARRYAATDVAAALSQLLGRTVIAQALPRSEWRESLRRAVSASTASLLVELYEAQSRGLIDVEPNRGELRHGVTELIEALRPFVIRPAEDETARALALVREYFASVGPTAEQFWRSFDTYFDEATVWENVGLSRTVGRDEAVRFARAFPVSFDHMRIEDLVLSGAGNRIHAERLDHFCTRGGTIVLTVRALGVFEIKGRKIAHWRDFFDTAGLLGAVGKQTA
jgi:uncharacterized protein YbjT (DUF2867 family)/limonene-1,2-epoxide hydrolase